MDTGSVLTRFFGRIGLSLGLVSYLELAAFLPPVITPLENHRFEISTKLEHCITDEIEALIKGSTEVGIAYYLTVYTNDNLVYRAEEKKLLRFNSLEKEYNLTEEENRQSFTLYSEALSELVQFRKEVDIENPRVMVLSAELIIPDLHNKELVRSLWHDHTPRLSYTFEDKP